MSETNQTTTTSPRYEAPSNVVQRGVGDDVVLLDLDNGTYFTLAATGAAIWKHLGAGLTTAEVSAAMINDYEVDAATVDRDIADLIERLTSSGLLRRL